jgi:chaperone BCS1
MLLWWVSTRSSTQYTRSSLATTDLASASTEFGSPNTKQRPIRYTPWNGRFLIWHGGHLLLFRREYRAGEFNGREEVSISCFSRSPRILRELLTECCTEYSKLVQNKTSLYEHQDGVWVRSVVSDIRPISTVILNESKKSELLKDIENYLDPASRQWYSSRGIPYRKGYLLHGPPGTGKSSLSLSIAGHTGLDIYILSLSAVTEDHLRDLFARLPSRCVVLLEDIDAVSSQRIGKVTTKDSRQSKPVAGRVPLSTLLNVIDGVGSREGRVLIMTTNHISHLDEALIRPGRVDKKVEFGLADRVVMTDLFCLVFKPVKADISSPKNAQSDVLVGEDRKYHEASRSQEEEVQKVEGEEVERVERLAEEFAAKVPELQFSPADILSFLLEYRQSPREAIDNMRELISKPTEAKLKPPKGSKNARPGDTQLEIERASR